MSDLAIKRTTVAEFLAWAETQENPCHELIDGEIAFDPPGISVAVASFLG
jgi:hypothetical protein